MRATAEVIEGNRVKLSVEVPEDELQTVEEETIRRLVREARIPGFRPGKVPRRLLVQRLGAKAIRDEVLREAMPEYYQQAVEDTELDIISAPEFDITAGSIPGRAAGGAAGPGSTASVSDGGAVAGAAAQRARHLLAVGRDTLLFVAGFG